jgi:CHAT domain-containing protein
VHEGRPLRGPDLPSLPKVADEVRLVKERFEAAKATITVVNDTSNHPTAAEVLANLQGSDVNILHLSCHGVQKKNPLASAFILRDGDLTIQELMKLDLKHALLAFLSACQTAKGSQYQPDQAVHLAASMLFCGFKSVIATMWYISFAIRHPETEHTPTGPWLTQMGQRWRDLSMRRSSRKKNLTLMTCRTHSMMPFDS